LEGWLLTGKIKIEIVVGARDMHIEHHIIGVRHGVTQAVITEKTVRPFRRRRVGMAGLSENLGSPWPPLAVR
jgi:hypothetical protein